MPHPDSQTREMTARLRIAEIQARIDRLRGQALMVNGPDDPRTAQKIVAAFRRHGQWATTVAACAVIALGEEDSQEMDRLEIEKERALHALSAVQLFEEVA